MFVSYFEVWRKQPASNNSQLRITKTLIFFLSFKFSSSRAHIIIIIYQQYTHKSIRHCPAHVQWDTRLVLLKSLNWILSLECDGRALDSPYYPWQGHRAVASTAPLRRATGEAERCVCVAGPKDNTSVGSHDARRVNTKSLLFTTPPPTYPFCVCVYLELVRVFCWGPV